jgi:folate-binding protein YgfZ
VSKIFFHEIVGAGLVKIVGESRKDYLQRQSSNDLSLLSPTLALPNILTAPNGRILEIFTIVEDGDDYLLTTPAERGETLSSYFQKRVFFNDQVEIRDHSKDWKQFNLLGEKWIEVLANIVQDQISIEPKNVSLGRLGEGRLWLITEKRIGNEASFLLIAPPEAKSKLKELFEGYGASELGDNEIEALRIGTRTPGTSEFFGDFTPFEIGLEDRVSASKGCYTGQEVLARQVTYDKITRSLVQLSVNGLATAGMEVLSEGKVVGKITSVYPKEDGSIALAVVKKPYNQAGTKIQLKNQSRNLLAKILAPSPEE